MHRDIDLSVDGDKSRGFTKDKDELLNKDKTNDSAVLRGRNIQRYEGKHDQLCR